MKKTNGSAAREKEIRPIELAGNKNWVLLTKPLTQNNNQFSSYYQDMILLAQVVNRILQRAVVAKYAIAPDIKITCQSLILSFHKKAFSQADDLQNVQQRVRMIIVQLQQQLNLAALLAIIAQLMSEHQIKFIYDKPVNIISHDYHQANNKEPDVTQPLLLNEDETGIIPTVPLDYSVLYKSGYTKTEIEKYLSLGATEVVLRKLADSSLQLITY